jgi:hypothetical protein
MGAKQVEKPVLTIRFSDESSMEFTSWQYAELLAHFQEVMCHTCKYKRKNLNQEDPF